MTRLFNQIRCSKQELSPANGELLIFFESAKLVWLIVRIGDEVHKTFWHQGESISNALQKISR